MSHHPSHQSPDSFRMNNKQQQNHTSSGAQPKRTIPVPKIVKLGHGAAAKQVVPPKPDPSQPLKPANVMKAANAQKYAPWLTTAKMPTKVVPRIP